LPGKICIAMTRNGKKVNLCICLVYTVVTTGTVGRIHSCQFPCLQLLLINADITRPSTNTLASRQIDKGMDSTYQTNTLIGERYTIIWDTILNRSPSSASGVAWPRYKGQGGDPATRVMVGNYVRHSLSYLIFRPSGRGIGWGVCDHIGLVARLRWVADKLALGLSVSLFIQSVLRTTDEQQPYLPESALYSNLSIFNINSKLFLG